MMQCRSLALVLLPAFAFGCAAEAKKPAQDQLPDGSEGVVGAGGGSPNPMAMGTGGKQSAPAGSGGSGAGQGGAMMLGTGGAPVPGGMGGRESVGGQGGMLASDRDARAVDSTGARDLGPTADASLVAGAFECSQFMGPNITAEWFRVFETLGDKAWNEAWQVKAPHASFADLWANPDHEVWKAPVESACPAGKKLERVVFVTQLGSWDSNNVSTWKIAISNGIKTIRMKYPTVKRVDLISFYRSTDNKPCPTPKESWVPAAHDEAHTMIAAESGGSVVVGPIVKVDCNMYAGPPYLTAAGKKVVAEAYYKHYSK